MKELREWRNKHNLTQADVAKWLGIRRKTVSTWEIGVVTPSKTLLEIINKMIKFDNIAKMLKNMEQCSVEGCSCFATTVKGKCYKCKYPTQVSKVSQGKDYKKISQINKEIRIKTHEEMSYYRTLPERLKYLRKKNGFNIEMIAIEFGVTKDTVEAWEEGTVTPSYIMLIDMASFYKVNCRYLEHGNPRRVGLKNE